MPAWVPIWPRNRGRQARSRRHASRVAQPVKAFPATPQIHDQSALDETRQVALGRLVTHAELLLYVDPSQRNAFLELLQDPLLPRVQVCPSGDNWPPVGACGSVGSAVVRKKQRQCSKSPERYRFFHDQAVARRTVCDKREPMRRRTPRSLYLLTGAASLPRQGTLRRAIPYEACWLLNRLPPARRVGAR